MSASNWLASWLTILDNDLTWANTIRDMGLHRLCEAAIEELNRLNSQRSES